ncbi:glycosyl transferase family 11 [Marinomonas ushuaiensis DSM 15871]|uniref:Glycosyl transferase family 11 n=1 Tax=Marinomonas ushuaiensis DSM 15871 TaxID=1122207 RepID=X7E9P8_9GAMM|nr:alpha-1,2-fucosyltransferase [Marinomonas ushuaiensis]ETX12585.1 glycosyl transferase family 11 [Marinomonas ushuaiensis DSM 15871]
MIIVKITGGLGNQLFQYALGRALSLKLGCELVLDISFYPLQTLRKYELDKFNIKARLATTTEIKKAGAGNNFTAKLVRKLGLTSLLYQNYIKELESFSYVNDIDDCKEGCYLDGYWQNPKYFEAFKKELCEDLSPVAPISAPAAKWLDKIKSTESVSLHVRRGDYVKNAYTNSVHGICSLEYYRNAIEHIQQQIDTPIFYIFSDDIQWCKDNLNFISNVNFVDDTCSVIDDLALMQKCKANIIANSTFSWWGAWLNSSQGLQVAPLNWFSFSDRNSQDIYPKLWRIL